MLFTARRSWFLSCSASITHLGSDPPCPVMGKEARTCLFNRCTLSDIFAIAVTLELGIAVGEINVTSG